MAPDSRMFSSRNLIVVLPLAEVHPGLEAAQLAARREVAFHVVGRAAAGHRVLLGRHEPEAVRVHQVGVDPVTLAGRRAGQPADRHDQVLRHRTVAGQRVPVHRQRAGELVEPLDLLQLLERAGDHGRVHQPEPGQVRRLAVQRRGQLRAEPVVGPHPDALDRIGQAGLVDLPLDVRVLLGQLVGLDHELLDDRRVDPADQDRRQHQQAQPDGGEQRAAPDRAGEEEDGAQHRDDREHGLGRQHGVDVGVGRAGGHRAALGEVDAPPVHPVGHALEQDEHPDQHVDLGLRGHGGPRPPGMPAQPAVEHVHRHRGQQRQEHRREQVAQHEAQEGVGEDEERDVEVELRVLAAERDPVDEQQPGTPGPRGGDPGDHADQAEHDPQQQPPVRVDRHPVGVHPRALGGRGRPVHRPQPVGEHGVEADHGRHEDPDHEEQCPPGPVDHAEDRRVIHRAVPEPVGPHPGDDGEQHAEDNQAGHHRYQVAGPAGQPQCRTARRPISLGWPEAHPVSLGAGAEGRP